MTAQVSALRSVQINLATEFHMSFATSIPRAAIFLGLAGTLPFLFAAFAPLSEQDALDLAHTYGLVILCFMAGTHWGFAAQKASLWYYGLSVIPALAAFFTLTDHIMTPMPLSPIAKHWMLTILFALLLPIDTLLQRIGLAPAWWLRLRGLITSIVLGALILIGLGQTP
jgi:hypothetical protein